MAADPAAHVPDVDPRPPPRKATLYCPQCAHASPIDGDWHVASDAYQVVLSCPDCGTTIDSRIDAQRDDLVGPERPLPVP